jgi:hypothetical protein
MAASTDSRTLQDYETSFLRILKNESKSQDRHNASTRTRGFLVVVRGGSNLKSLQSLCAEEIVSLRNSCVTARYRLQSTAGVGTLLFAFLSDLYRLRRQRERLDGDETTAKTDLVAGDLSPAPSPESWTETWGSLIDRYLDRIITSEAELAEGLRDPSAQGVLKSDQLYSLLARFDDESSVLKSGDRLVLFAELSEDATNPREWEPALQMLLEHLPERVGIVFSGVPKDIRLDIADNDPHFLELTLPKANEAATPAQFVYKFTDSSFHSDVPASKDELSVDSYANALARFVLHRDTQPPLTIGIHGPWGKGKSSFMRLIASALIKYAEANRERTQEWNDLVTKIVQMEAKMFGTIGDDLRPQTFSSQLAYEYESYKEAERKLWEQMIRAARKNVLSIFFNAWQFEDARQTWAGLASEISAQMEMLLPWHSKLWLRIKYAWKERRSDLLLNLVLPLAVFGSIAGYLGFRFFLGGPVASSLVYFLTVGSAGAWVFSSQFLKVAQPVSERVLTYMRLPNYRDQMGFQHRVKNDLQFVHEFLVLRLKSSIVGARTFRVVVYIDDLDRCSENKIMELLQAINLILADCKFFVFVGMDTDMIYRAINSYYKEPVTARFADNYLSKIIQISFHLPETKSHTRSGYLGTLFSLGSRLELKGRLKNKSVTAQPAEVNSDVNYPVAFPFDMKDVLQIVPVHVKEAPDTADELQAFTEYSEFIDDNPREIKRLINIHRLLKILLQQPNTSWSTERQKKLVKWLIFCDMWPHLVGNITDAPTNNASDNCLLDLANSLEGELKNPTSTTAVPQFDRLAEFAKFVPKMDRGSSLSADEIAAQAKAHALSSDDIDEDFRRAAKLSQMVRKPPRQSKPVAPPPHQFT